MAYLAKANISFSVYILKFSSGGAWTASGSSAGAGLASTEAAAELVSLFEFESELVPLDPLPESESLLDAAAALFLGGITMNLR